MSRSFTIFIVFVLFLLLVLFAARLLYFKYEKSYTYYYNLVNNTIAFRQNIEHREWLADLLRDYDFNIKNGPRLYLVPVVFPEIKYRFPYRWKEVKINSNISDTMLKFRSGRTESGLISIRWEISPEIGSVIIYQNNSGHIDRTSMSWAQTQHMINLK